MEELAQKDSKAFLSSLKVGGENFHHTLNPSEMYVLKMAHLQRMLLPWTVKPGFLVQMPITKSASLSGTSKTLAVCLCYWASGMLWFVHWGPSQPNFNISVHMNMFHFFFILLPCQSDESLEQRKESTLASCGLLC